MEFPKPNVVVSKCLGFDNCRYNGQMLGSDFIDSFKGYINFITVCPEVEIGLGVPRNPVRIVKTEKGEDLVDSESGVSHSAKMNNFSDNFLDGLNEIDGFILKSGSPSCGIKNVKTYKTAGKVRPLNAKTVGFFAKKVIDKFPFSAIEDEGRLRNYKIREHFLTMIYTFSRFRKISSDPQMKNLVKFHSINKYLFMAYNPRVLKILGKIVANHDKKDAEDVFALYHKNLIHIFDNYRKDGMNNNALLHMYGYFNDRLSDTERKFFLNELEKYRLDMNPLSVPLAILRSWVIRFDEPYLKDQTILIPYPEELITVSDSGKGRI